MSDSYSLEDFKCPICFCILIEPVTMPCNHRLCMTCFSEHIDQTSLTCPLCRCRISTWCRKSKSKNLVDVKLWQFIQEKFPVEVAARLNGNDDINGDSGDNGRVSCVSMQLSEPGEIRREFEVQLQKMAEEEERRKKKEEEASLRLIHELEAQEKLRIDTRSKLEGSNKGKSKMAVTLGSDDSPSTSSADLANSGRCRAVRGPMDHFVERTPSVICLTPAASATERPAKKSDSVVFVSATRTESIVCLTPVKKTRQMTPSPELGTRFMRPVAGASTSSNEASTSSNTAIASTSDGVSKQQAHMLPPQASTATTEGERSISECSHDSIERELVHFKPIKTVPTTPPMKLPDGRTLTHKIVKTTPRNLNSVLVNSEGLRTDNHSSRILERIQLLTAERLERVNNLSKGTCTTSDDMAVSTLYTVTGCVSSMLTSLGNKAFQFLQPGNTSREQQMTADVAAALHQSHDSQNVANSKKGKAEVKAQEREPSRTARRDPSGSSVSSYSTTCSRSRSPRSSRQNSCTSVQILSEVENNVRNVCGCQTYCERSVCRKALGRTLSDSKQNSVDKRQHTHEESCHVDEFDRIDGTEDSNSEHNSRVKTRKKKSQLVGLVQQGRIKLNSRRVCNGVNRTASEEFGNRLRAGVGNRRSVSVDRGENRGQNYNLEDENKNPSLHLRRKASTSDTNGGEEGGSENRKFCNCCGSELRDLTKSSRNNAKPPPSRSCRTADVIKIPPVQSSRGKRATSTKISDCAESENRTYNLRKTRLDKGAPSENVNGRATRSIEPPKRQRISSKCENESTKKKISEKPVQKSSRQTSSSKSASLQPCRRNRSSNSVHAKETNNNVVPVKTSLKRSHPSTRQTTPSSRTRARDHEDGTDSLRPLEKQKKKSASDNMDFMTEQERKDLEYALSLQKQFDKESRQVDRSKGGELAYQLRSNATC